MTFLLQLYPGDQFMLLVATMIGQVAVILVLAFALTRFPKRRPAATRSAIWIAELACVLLTPLLACGFSLANVELVRLPFLARAEPKAQPRLPMKTSPVRALPDTVAPNTAALNTVAPNPNTPTANSSEPAPGPGQHVKGPDDFQDHASVKDFSPKAIDTASKSLASKSSALTAADGGDHWRAAAVCGVLLWFAGVSLFAVRFLYGCLILKRLRTNARPVDDQAAVAIHEDVCRVLGIDRYPQIMTSRQVGGPIATSGLRGPMVILPDGLLRGLKDHQLRDVLMHECAHLLQRDILLGVCQRIAQIIYWLHPMVHFLNRELSRAREDICDNYVVRHGDAPGYARTLVQLSTALPHQRTPIAACGMFNPISQLETRIEALLDEGRDLMTLTKRSLLLSFGLFFFGLSVLSFGSKLVEAAGVEVADAAASDPNTVDQKKGNNKQAARDRGTRNTGNQKTKEAAGDDGNPLPEITGLIMFKARQPSRILAVAISPDDELIATVDEQSKVDIRSAKSGAMLLSFSVLKPKEKALLLHEGREGRIHTAALAFEPDPRKLTRTLAVACDSVIRFYDSETARPLRSLEDKRFVAELKELGKDDPAAIKRLTTIAQAHGRVYSIAFSKDGSLLASCGSHLLRPGGRSVISSDTPTHGMLKLWDTKTGELKHDLGKHFGRVKSLAFSTDRLAAIGKHAAGWTSGVRLWHPGTGKVESTFTIPGMCLSGEAVVVSPDGALVAAVVITPDPDPKPADNGGRLGGWGIPTLLVWNAKTRDLIIKRKMPKPVTLIAFSPDSKTLATCSNVAVTFWDPKSLREKGRLQTSTKPPWPAQLAFSTSGTRMAITANHKNHNVLTFWKLDVPIAKLGGGEDDEKKTRKPALEGSFIERALEDINATKGRNSNQADVNAGNGFGKVTIRELELRAKGGRSRLRLDTGKLLPAFAAKAPSQKTWHTEDGKQVELVRHGEGIALAFYNVSAKYSATSWSNMSPVGMRRFLEAIDGVYAFRDGDKFSVQPIDLNKMPVTFILDGGVKLELTKATFTDAPKINVRYASIKNDGRAIVVQGTKPAECKGLPPLKWGKPWKGLIAAHEILAKDNEIQLGQQVSVRHYVRNTGTSIMSFQYDSRNFATLWVAGKDGKWRTGNNVSKLGFPPTYKVILKPGEQWDFGHPGKSWDYDYGGYTFVVETSRNQGAKPFVNARPLCQPGMYQFKFTLPLGQPVSLKPAGTTAATSLLVKKK